MGQNDDMTIRAPDPGDSDRFNQVPNQEPQNAGFQEAPRFDAAPPPPTYSEPPRPTEVPSYGEVVEPPKKKNNKTLWIIIAIVLAVVCCCCIVGIVSVSNYMKDMNFDLEDLLNEFSQIIRVAPAFL